MSEAKQYELEYSLGGMIGEMSEPDRKLLERKNGFESDEDAVVFVQSYVVGDLLYPAGGKVGAHRVKYRVLLNGVAIAEGGNDRFKYGME